ncbi:ankyrin [Coemansia reversa NRRL 1564]|uniref:Ankyrin n=1 Tax=Coemansia reversa (strain ATCC 12441 / NRRL 1564) TaxID=763665 RepID=A0A2G5BDX0_COERN|nr:ankyrin [Coemansia reversa NRRL 1564]|eukprot:PIA17205.1 ankyrin [Coemansia reversa NRRL 1564]
MSRSVEKLISGRSPLAGVEQRILREWVAQWTFDIDEFSPLAQALVRGDIGALRREYQQQVEQLQEQGAESEIRYRAGQAYRCMRETRIGMPAMEVVIAGAQYFVGRRAMDGIVAANQNIRRSLDHESCLRFLADIGVSVDGEDVAGFTAFMRASQTKHSRLDLAEVLLELGADVNHRSRFGGVALHEAIMAQDRTAVAFLSRNGADMDIKDNDGVSPRDIVSLVL